VTKIEQLKQLLNQQTVAYLMKDGTCREVSLIHIDAEAFITGSNMVHLHIEKVPFEQLFTLEKLSEPERRTPYRMYTGAYNGIQIDFMHNHDPRLEMRYLQHDDVMEQEARTLYWCRHQAVQAFDKKLILMEIDDGDGDEYIIADEDWERFIPYQTHKLVPIEWEES